jgi:hypothetical protein
MTVGSDSESTIRLAACAWDVGVMMLKISTSKTRKRKILDFIEGSPFEWTNPVTKKTRMSGGNHDMLPGRMFARLIGRKDTLLLLTR